jgi:hypothetical protein
LPRRQAGIPGLMADCQHRRLFGGTELIRWRGANCPGAAIDFQYRLAGPPLVSAQVKP